MRRYETIVVGLGAMGSAALYHLAGQSGRVLGLDRFAPPHPYGSTHGDTRITRQAIGEGASYAPLVLRSYELWRALERETGRELLTVTGGLILGSPDGTSAHHGRSDFLERTIAVAREFHIPHTLLDTAEIRRRFPQFNLSGDEIGYFEETAGYLRPEACVAAHLEVAARRGAEVQTGETVLGFTAAPGDEGVVVQTDRTGETVLGFTAAPGDEGVVVQTDRGAYVADTLILTAGPWIASLLDTELARLFAVYRQVLYWFDVKDGIEPFLSPAFPIFIWIRDDGDVYGFPAIDGPGGGVKVATEIYEQTTTADTVAREVSPQEVQEMYRWHVAGALPGLSERCVKAVACPYTVTPDSHFVIDRHPRSPQVIVASPCSGHGFKHSAAIGEALAQLATHGATALDISEFRLNRLLNG